MLRSVGLSFILCSGCFGLEVHNYATALERFENDNEKLGSLVGQLFCHVALGNYDKIDPMIIKIDQRLKPMTNCDTPPDNGPLTKEKQMRSYNCRRHIREVSNEMRQTVEKLVRETVPGTFQKIKILRQLYPFIDTLEQVGIECCQSNYPLNCCLDPLLEQLNGWKDIGLGSL